MTQVTSSHDFHKGNEVHVIQTSVTVKPQYFDILSQPEKNQVQRFKFTPDQNRFISTYGTLRSILASYLACDERSILLAKSKQGKPYIKNNGLSLRFNITHSRHVICYVFSLEKEVGIDIEYIDTDFQWISFAKKYLSPSELNQLFELPVPLQTLAFYNLWTKKEAYLKGMGIGLSGLTDWITVRDESPQYPWTIKSFDYQKNYLGALAVQDLNPSVRFFSLMDLK